jgi:hypothetical protein
MTWNEFATPTVLTLVIFVLLTIGVWLILTSHKAKIRFFSCMTQAAVPDPKEYSKDMCGLWQFTGGFTGMRIELTPAGILVIGIVLILLPYMASCMISSVIAGEWTDIDHKGIQIVSKNEKDSIGSAWMEKDGTIVLQLRAEGPDGLIGDALLRYPRTHPEYKNILRHLGGLKKGEIKQVPPWPSK